MSCSSVLNLALIQVGWLVAVLGVANGHPWPGPVFSAAVLIFYLSASSLRGRELLLILACTSVGFVVDSGLVQLDLVRFAAPWPSDAMAPAWTLGLWALLATGFSRSMAWLRGKPTLALVLASIAPFTYWGGARLGAADFPEGLASALVGIGAGWAVALPLLAVLAARIIPFAIVRCEKGRSTPDNRDGHREGAG